MRFETGPLVKSISDTALPRTRAPFLFRLSPLVFRPAFREVAVVLFDQGLCSVSNFLISVLVARVCSVTDYGYYVLGFTLLTTVRSVQVNLSGTPYTMYHHHLKGNERRKYLGSVLVQQTIISVMGAIAFVFAGALALATGQPRSFAQLLFALAPASLFVALRDLARYVLLADLRVGANLLMSLTVNLATIGMLFWAYTAGWLSATFAYVIMAVGSALPLLFIMRTQGKAIAVDRTRFRAHFQQNWSFGKWLLAHTVVYFFAVQLYPWALVILKGPAAAGLYGACMTLAGVFNPLFMGVAAYLGPKTARAACSRISQVHRQVYLSMALIAAPLLICLIAAFLFRDWIMLEVYGDEYVGAGKIFFLCFLSAIITAQGIFLNQGVNALWRSDIALRAQLIALGGTIAVGFPLMYSFGVFGAAVGVCISRGLSAGYQVRAFQALNTLVGGTVTPPLMQD